MVRPSSSIHAERTLRYQTAYLLPLTSNHDGFVSIRKASPAPIAAFLIMARGKGCCGSVMPTGSSAPGKICTGSPEDRTSVRKASSV